VPRLIGLIHNPQQPHVLMADMDVDVDTHAVASKKDDSKKRFEVKKVCARLRNPGNHEC
jgi:hypothetical protein